MRGLIVFAFMLLCASVAMGGNKKDGAITQSRFIPVQVSYEFLRESEVQDPALVQIKKIRVCKQYGRSSFYITVLNKTRDLVDIDGDISFYDKQGNEVFVIHADGEIFGQAEPGLSEGCSVPSAFGTVNINQIARAKVIIRKVWTDIADRD